MGIFSSIFLRHRIYRDITSFSPKQSSLKKLFISPKEKLNSVLNQEESVLGAGSSGDAGVEGGGATS